MYKKILLLFVFCAAPFILRSATFIVNNTNLAGAGSLQQAMLDANANPGPDVIAFNIGSGGLSISPTNALPTITDPVTIDGTTQPGYSNSPLVEINGSVAGALANGFLVATDTCVIRALAINGFRSDAIQITNGTGNQVIGCYLGVAPDGVSRRGNAGAGVRITSYYLYAATSNNIIGGAAVSAHNVISANGYGVFIEDSPGNAILGNRIGTDAAGAFDLGNTNSGVYVYDYLSILNTIGGTNAGEGNLISGNGEGQFMYGADGVLLFACYSNSVYGNYIGVDAAGAIAIPNGEHGVNIRYGGDHIIGGPLPGQNNVIGGNLVNGINIGQFGKEVAINTASPVLPDGNVIQGNLIGTDASGQSAIPNQNDGIFIVNDIGNLIGGSSPGEGNVISGNLNFGIELACCGNTYSNLITGNLIGVTRTNLLPLGNVGIGISIGSGPNGIGGTNAGDPNVIAYNGGSGVQVSYNSTAVPILGNSIYGNTNIGIDLIGNYGVDPNDPGDTDYGGNNVQNYPVLGFPLQFPSQVIISGTLNSASNTTYRIELFDNETNDPTGYGQGQTFLGFVNLTTDSGGDGSFTFTNPATLPLSHWISATATDPGGNTSEFALSRRVARPDSVDLTVTITNSVNPAPRSSSFFFTITVTNSGPANATGVVATDVLPAGLSFMSAVSSQGSCVQNNGTVTCNLGSLAAGDGATVTITVNATITAQVTNTVSAAADQIENDPSDNSATVATALGVADLGVLTFANPDPVVAGQTVTYTVIATNLGPDPATGSTLYYYVDGMSVATGAGVSQGTVNLSYNAAYCNFGTIPANGAATLTVTAVPTGVGTAFNYATDGALENDLNSNNNSTNQSSGVIAGPGVIQFATAVYSVNESAGTAVIAVLRTGGAIGAVSVDFATSNLTAIAGQDYTATNGTLVFADGETSKSFLVRILDDGLADCNESLALRLFNGTGGAVLIGQTNATLQIFDNHRVPGGLVQCVSLANTNLATAGASASFTPSLSDDGRYVAFGSYANNLVASPQTYAGAVFVYDRNNKFNTMVSLDVTGFGAPNNYVAQPQISADGQRVAFLTGASNLTTNEVFGFYQVFVRNLATGSNQLVSVNTNGAGGNNSSDRFTISTNGSKIAFRSYASDLVPGDTNSQVDIFYRDLAAGTNALVSINSAGTGTANGYSDSPVISADGRYVAFGSYASNILPGDNNTRFDIYRRDMVSNVTALASANGSGFAGNNSCGGDVFISGDGRYVAFESYATDLAPGSTFFSQEVFVRDMISGTNNLVSVNNSNVAANSTCYLHGLSRDGRYVLFESYGNNLYSNDTSFNNDVFLRDTVSNVTYLVDMNLAGTSAGNDYSYSSILSSDGRYVSFLSAATDLVAAGKQPSIYDAFVRDMQTGVTTLLSSTPGGASGNSTELAISPSGVAAFGSNAGNLAPADDNFGEDVFTRAPGQSAPQLVSQGIGVTGDAPVADQRVSGDGTKVVIVTEAGNLVANDTNHTTDVFLRDVATGTTVLVSSNAPAGASDQPSLSTDGRYIAFHDAPLDSTAPQVWLQDTVSNLATLLSVKRTGVGPGNGESRYPQITPDGSFVVFESVASDLVSNDLNGSASDVFIRRRANSVAELVSVNAAGSGSANGASFNPVVSDDGRYVAFGSYAGNLGPADTTNTADVYVRDRQSGSNILCSPNLTGTSGGNQDSFPPVISGNGRYVVFTSYASDLAAGDTNESSDVFAFDVLTRTLQLVSRTPGGIPGNGYSQNPSVSADGRYVVFESTSSDLVMNENNGGFSDIFVRDLVAKTTTLVSVNCGGSGCANDSSFMAQISRNGRYVTFESYASDLAPGDYSVYGANVFRRDLQAGTTTLVSQNLGLLAAGNSSSYNPQISDNGGAISFISSASDLIPGDANNFDDAFVWTAAVNSNSVDLAVTKTASTNSVAQGGAVTYSIGVTNFGFTNATSVVVTDALPAGLTFVSAVSTQGTVTNNGGLVTGNLGTLGIGAGVRITINVTANTAGYVTNSAVASASQSDLNLANNTGSAVVLVTGSAPPTLSASVTNGSQLFLSWPSSTSGFHLQTSTNLNPVIVWSPVTNSISDNGLIKFVILNVNASESGRFYRLQSP